MSRRTEKIASELKGEIVRLLREEATDPRIRFVTITRVDVAPDLSNAVLFYSVMNLNVDDADAIEQVDDGLYSAAAFLRRRAARALPLRRMPALRFRYDPSLALGTQTLAVLRELGTEGAAPDDAQRRAERSDADGEKA